VLQCQKIIAISSSSSYKRLRVIFESLNEEEETGGPGEGGGERPEEGGRWSRGSGREEGSSEGSGRE
jgi:hypothetical protein